jgi:hypothetical protein
MRPLRVEASTIKLWLARVANHMKHVLGPHSEDVNTADLVGLFGPCSPTRHSSTSDFFASLADACMPPSDSLPYADKSVATACLDQQVLPDDNGGMCYP